jgi:hypothetical protein
MKYEDLQSPEERGRTFVTVGMNGSMVTSEVEPIPGMTVCDFCSAPNPTYVFEAEDVQQGQMLTQAGVTDFVSVGGWAACKRCAVFIRADDRQSLIEHSMATFEKRHPELAALGPDEKAEVRQSLVDSVDRFFAARKRDC